MASKSDLQAMQGFHAVAPKTDCPHCNEDDVMPAAMFEGITVNDECPDCHHKGENWVCLKPGCRTVRCSRYVESHMCNHRIENMDHHICFSFADFSFWCYSCDSYVVHPTLTHNKFFYSQKFGTDSSNAEVFQKMKDSKHQEQIKEEEEDENEDEQEEDAPAQAASNEEEKKQDEESKSVDMLVNAVKQMKIKGEGDFDYDDLVQGLKDGTFKRILVLTGAGISVSAGIPDFRSPGTGVYDNLKEYNLPRPESLFTLDYFKANPEPFYKFAKNFDLDNFDPTPTHYFIKLLQEKNVLWKNLTQNIDNLEEKTGMDMFDVLQCHGANKGAACSKCKKESDPAELQQGIRDFEIKRCQRCGNPIKPDIVFFGEALPIEFHSVIAEISSEVDLLIVMGTALAVSPFNILPSMVSAGVPKVLFNMDNTKETGGLDFTEEGRKKLFVQGKCDETVRKLMGDCGWAEEFETILPECHKTTQAE